jgi:hypothetical protein
MKRHLQNTQNKMDRRCGSSSRVPALQVQSPEFKHYEKQKKFFLKTKIKISKASLAIS